MRVTQKREEINTRVRNAGRRLFLSNALADFSESNGTLQQAEFLMRVLERELELREENKKK